MHLGVLIQQTLQVQQKQVPVVRAAKIGGWNAADLAPSRCRSRRCPASRGAGSSATGFHKTLPTFQICYLFLHGVAYDVEEVRQRVPDVAGNIPALRARVIKVLLKPQRRAFLSSF